MSISSRQRSDSISICPLDRVNRDFRTDRPNPLRVLNFIGQGRLDVAFVSDLCARRIIGWRVSTSIRIDLMLDALEQALDAL
jgi:putative transposase